MKKFIAIVVFVAACLGGWIWWGINRSYRDPVVTHYTLEEPDTGAIRAVLIADLHDQVFGEDNEQVYTLVKEQEPDVILLAGDLLNEDSASTDTALSFVRRMTEIAPVYVSLGNQEMGFIERNGTGFLDDIRDTGAVLLELDYADTEINGQKIRIGGMYEYAFPTGGGEDYEAIKTFLTEFEGTEDCKIMMAHRPDSFVFLDDNPWDIDLVVSGHLHGGQVILPLLGGLWAPDQGFFPEYDYGKFDLNGTDIIITTGLGSSDEKLPRFNNPPEIAVIDLNHE